MTDKTDQLRKIAEALWELLDDIDTESDAIKPVDEAGYKAFYEAAMRHAQKRHRYMASDGYNLIEKNVSYEVRKEITEGEGL